MAAIAGETYAELGRYSRPITAANAEAKSWFDRGLVWCYGFNMEEGLRCFERAAAADPGCAMAHWGIAYARGPFYNKPWDYFSAADAEEAAVVCHGAISTAAALAHRATPVEQALVAAALRRFPAPTFARIEQCLAWEDDFAAAMRDAHGTFPDDLDVAAVAGLALMTRTPWKLWDIRTGRPAAGAATLEARRILETGLAAAARQGVRPHPGLAHVYIHAMEMSPRPETALAAADSLRDYSRDCGHLHHMPAHIYAQCGLYQDAILASEKAVAADARYVPQPGAREFYVLDRSHHLHMLSFAACMLGRFQPAIAAADRIAELLTPDVLAGLENPYLARAMEGWHGHRWHVLVRFGKWREILAEPLPGNQALYPVSTAMAHYAKGVAAAALGDAATADRERAAFAAASARVPADRFFHNNPAADILAVGGAMLEGEAAYHRGRCADAFAHLRRAVELDDGLAYSEPWPWMHPPRHALGALLLEQGHVEDAAGCYRADLGLDGTLPRPKQNPGNVWSLRGYADCLKRLGRLDEARIIDGELKIVLARADVEVRASCCCATAAHR